MDVLGLEKKYVICLHDVFYTNSRFLGPPAFVLIPSSQQLAPGISHPTEDVGQLSNDFV